MEYMKKGLLVALLLLAGVASEMCASKSIPNIPNATNSVINQPVTQTTQNPTSALINWAKYAGVFGAGIVVAKVHEHWDKVTDAYHWTLAGIKSCWQKGSNLVSKTKDVILENKLAVGSLGVAAYTVYTKNYLAMLLALGLVGNTILGS